MVDAWSSERRPFGSQGKQECLRHLSRGAFVLVVLGFAEADWGASGDQAIFSALGFFARCLAVLRMRRAVVASAAVLPQSSAVKTEPARIVTDETGRRVAIPADVKRVVTLAPNLTETIYALGLEERLAGDTDYCDTPPAAKLKPHVGGPQNPSLEAIVALHPDLGAGDDLDQPAGNRGRAGEDRSAGVHDGPADRARNARVDRADRGRDGSGRARNGAGGATAGAARCARARG